MPRIGLIADTHAQAVRTVSAVGQLLDHDVQMIIHLGDVNSLAVLDALAVNDPQTDEQLEVRVVFGNTDYDAEDFSRYARELGLIVDHPAGEMDVEGGKLFYTHGHRHQLMRDALDRGVKYLCHGHTHRMMDQMMGETRVINPGAFSRVTRATVAVLDTRSEKLEFLTVGEKLR